MREGVGRQKFNNAGNKGRDERKKSRRESGRETKVGDGGGRTGG